MAVQSTKTSQEAALLHQRAYFEKIQEGRESSRSFDTIQQIKAGAAFCFGLLAVFVGRCMSMAALYPRRMFTSGPAPTNFSIMAPPAVGLTLFGLSIVYACKRAFLPRDVVVRAEIEEIDGKIAALKDS